MTPNLPDPHLLEPAELGRLSSKQEPTCSQLNSGDKGNESIPPLIPNLQAKPGKDTKSRAAKPQPGWAPQEHSDLGLYFGLYLWFRLQLAGQAGTEPRAALTPRA